MEFTVNTKKFKEILNKVTAILGVEEIKLTNYIKLTADKNNVNIQANNLEGGISVNIEADIIKTGTATVAAKLINTLVSKTEAETLKIQTEQNQLIISSDGIKAELRTTEFGFTEYPAPANGQTITTNSQEFAKALATASVFCNEKATNGLQGVNISFTKAKTKAIGFSSNMGGVYETATKEENEASFIISKKCASILETLCKNSEAENISLTIENNLLFYTDTNTIFTSRLISAKYPDVNRIFANNKAQKQIVDKQKLIKALDRISCFIPSECMSPVILETTGNTLKLNIKSELGENTEEIPVENAQNGTIVALNCNYLMKILKKTDTDKINFCVNGPLQPAFITTDNTQFVISPVRTSQTSRSNTQKETTQPVKQAA